MTVIYGIKNCDTVKKALKWLAGWGVDFTFHDYKKDGVPPEVLKRAMAAHGWEEVINRRGTTWRQLPDSVREQMDEARAFQTALDNPSLIKRPLLIHKGKIYLGFDQDLYQRILG